VITAVEDESVAADAKSLGAEAFLTKPMNTDSLMAAINSAVESGISDTSLPSVSSVHGVSG
jgi:FixJ family two-component response regulator